LTSRGDLRIAEDVRSEASTRLHELLSRHPASGGRKVIVRIGIRTVITLAPEAEGTIRASLDDVSNVFRDVVTIVEFTVDAALGGRYEVTCERVMRTPAKAQSAPHQQAADLPRDGQQSEPTQPGGIDADDEPYLLVLSFGSLRFEYLLESRPNWVPLFRPDAIGDVPDALVIPRSMAPVPSGRLIEVRFSGGVLRMRRTQARPGAVTVAVNGSQLTADKAGDRVDDRRGTIEYRSSPGGQPCTLRYELVVWQAGALGPAGRPDQGDGSPYQVVLTVAGVTGTLEIAPPPSGERARSRSFPIPTSTPQSPHRDIHTQVLYTRGAGRVSVTADWHVKIYRCATPQHAAWLRTYLRTQAVLIEQINATAGGTPQAPPWAIAPVHVIPPHSGRSLPTTDFAFGERDISDDPENRLSAWFGVTGKPQPDCFVIVVSPLLNKVEWPDSEHRTNAPGGEQLPALAALAAGLDACHDRDLAHCDVKPDNVCRYVQPDGSTGYVLVDGDAVTRLSGSVSALRFTPAYASAEIIARARQVRAPDRPDVPLKALDLREHDRFGFVLVVLTAVVGRDRIAGLIAENHDGKREIDVPDAVERAFRFYWSDEWRPFVDELLTPFEPDALVGDNWTAERWLKELDTSGTPARPEEIELAKEPPAPGQHARHIDEIRAEVRESTPGRADWLPEVIKKIKEHQLQVAREGYRKVVRFGAISLIVALIVLVGVILG